MPPALAQTAAAGFGPGRGAGGPSRPRQCFIYCCTLLERVLHGPAPCRTSLGRLQQHKPCATRTEGLIEGLMSAGCWQGLNEPGVGVGGSTTESIGSSVPTARATSQTYTLHCEDADLGPYLVLFPQSNQTRLGCSTTGVSPPAGPTTAGAGCSRN